MANINGWDFSEILANIPKIQAMKARKAEEKAAEERAAERFKEAAKERRKKEAKAEAEGWAWMLDDFDTWAKDWKERQQQRNNNKKEN